MSGQGQLRTKHKIPRLHILNSRKSLQMVDQLSSPTSLLLMQRKEDKGGDGIPSRNGNQGDTGVCGAWMPARVELRFGVWLVNIEHLTTRGRWPHGGLTSPMKPQIIWAGAMPERHTMVDIAALESYPKQCPPPSGHLPVSLLWLVLREQQGQTDSSLKQILTTW